MKRTAILALVIAISVSANAYLLDWGTVDYEYLGAGPGNAVTFTNVDGSGIDITLEMADVSGLKSTFPDDEDHASWGAVGQTWSITDGFWYASDTGSISFLIKFSQDVSDVSFNIYDVDGQVSGYEQTRVKGFYGGAGVDPMAYMGVGAGDGIEIVGMDEDGVTYSNLGYAPNPNPGPGDVWNTASFVVAATVDQVGCRFENTDGQSQGQIIGDISFVPEPATLTLLGLGLLAIRKRK